MKYICVLMALTFACAALLYSEDQPSSAMSKMLHTAQDLMQQKKTNEAVALLRAWTQDDHSLRQILLGRCQVAAEDSAAATLSFQQALKLNPQSRDAAMLLVEQYYHRQQWADVCVLLGQWLDVHTVDTKLLQLYSIAAYENKDYRLAERLVAQGIIRFPQEKTFRSLDVQLLMQRESWPQAAAEIQYLLRHPGYDRRLWQHLAFIRQQQNDDTGYSAALEAAYVLDPQNRSKQRAHAQAQLSLGHVHEAFIHLKELLTKTSDSTNTANTTNNIQNIELLRLGIHAAQESAHYQQALDWLQMIPDAQRDQNLRLSALRLHIRQGQQKQATGVMDALIASSEYRADILLWAAQIAEKNTDYARAEVMYQLCRKNDASGKNGEHKEKQTRWRKIANVYLARLLSIQHRNTEAQKILREHLKEFPTDSYAIMLQAMLKSE